MDDNFKNLIPNLRKKAEDLLAKKRVIFTATQLSDADFAILQGEIDVLEGELEMQHDEFLIAKELYSTTLQMHHEQELQNIELEMQKEALAEARLEMKESAKRYAEFYDNAASGFFTLNTKGEIMELNHYGANLLGKPKESLGNVRFVFFVSEATKSNFIHFLNVVFNTSNKQACEVEIVSQNGQTNFCQLIGIATETGDKCLLTITNISEQKRFQDASIADNLRLQLAMEAGKIAWWEMDIATGNVTFDNRKAVMLGFLPEDFTHFTHYTALVHPDDIDRIMDAMRQHIYGTAKKYEVEYRIRTKSGAYIWTLDIGSIIKTDVNGKPLVVAGLVIDTTERKLAEALKSEALGRIQKIASRVPGVVFQFKLCANGTSCFPYASPAINYIYRISPEDVLEDATKVFDTIHPDDVEGLTTSIQHSANTLTVWQYKYRVKFEDGTIRFLYGDSIPQLEPDGSVLWHGYISDITEQMMAEKKIQQKDQQYRDMFEKNTAVKLVINPDTGLIINANFAAEKFYGYSVKQLESMNIDQINMMSTNEIKSLMSNAKEGNSKCFYFQHRLASGEIKDVEVYSGPFELDGQTVLNSIIHDITDRKRAEQELANIHRRLENIVEGAHVGTWEWNIQTGETIFNDVWANLLGYTLDELAPVSIKTWTKIAHPEDLKQSNAILKKHFAGELPFYEFECRAKHKSGRWIWLHDRGLVITRSEDGTPLMMFGTHTDITERKQAEEALRISQMELKKFASHLQHIHDEERILLARKIHDELAQTLIVMKIDMGMLKNTVLKKTENNNVNDVLDKFNQLFDLVNTTIKTTSVIMTGLRPEALYLLGLIEAIPLFLDLYEKKYGIICRFENLSTKIDINTQQSVAMFRILQEALENVALHAKATVLEISLRSELNMLTLKIEDNGIGFDEKKILKLDTYGFIGMKERALFVNGEFSITSILGKGTTIIVKIPLIL